MIYKTVYCFSVMDEVEKGETVYALDKQDKVVLTLNALPFEIALGLLRDAKENDNRYEFWKEQENV